MSEPAEKPKPLPYELHRAVVFAQEAFTASQAVHEKSAEEHNAALEAGREEVRNAPAHEHDAIRAKHTPKITSLRAQRHAMHKDESKARADLEDALRTAHELERQKAQRLFLK